MSFMYIKHTLFVFSKREEEKKRGVLTNPVKMKEIQKMVSRIFCMIFSGQN